jgi:ribosomal protein S18 acetylase RimI-like enzyme
VDGEKIGLISHCDEPNGCVRISGVVVLPGHRKKGIARVALQKILDRIGKSTVRLFVHPANTPAIMLYLQLHFVIKDWIQDCFGDGEARISLERNEQATPPQNGNKAPEKLAK